jgi:hypothetical protein
MDVAHHTGQSAQSAALAALARSAATAAREGRPPAIALEAGVGLLREYYEAHPETGAAETAARCAQIIAAYPRPSAALEFDWCTGTARMAAVFGLLMTNVLGSLIEAEGARFDPQRAAILYHRALTPRAPQAEVRVQADIAERLLRDAGQVRWRRWSARLARVTVLALRLSEHANAERDRFVEQFFDLLSPAVVARLCRRADRALIFGRGTGGT